ncbi:MAG: hypothetical protein QM770_22950 [Tepidisphaeraceae bacterium]
MLTLIALLAIALLLAVSVARHVRATSAQELTRNRLSQLVLATKLYLADHGNAVPTLELIEAGAPEESSVRAWARTSSIWFVERMDAWQTECDAQAPPKARGPAVDDTLMRDAWGSPIALLARPHSTIGLSPGEGPFFFSAGPDREYLTVFDNLYSYEVTGQLPARAPGESVAESRERRGNSREPKTEDRP